MQETTIRFEATTYTDPGLTEYEAVYVRWPEVARVLGHEHRGCDEDDAALVAALIAAGAPSWVGSAAEGWTDEWGWGLIGPGTTAR